MEIRNFEQIAALLKTIPDYADFTFFNGDNPYEIPTNSSITFIVKLWGQRKNDNQVAFEFLLYGRKEDEIVELLEKHIKEDTVKKSTNFVEIEPIEKMEEGNWKLQKVLFRMK